MKAGLRSAVLLGLMASSLVIPTHQAVANSTADGLAVSLGDFELTCNAVSVAEGASLSCALAYGGSDAAEWPLVGLLHSSGDVHRALVAGVGIDVEFGNGIPDIDVQRSNEWVGQELIGFSRHDWSGDASPSDVKSFTVDAIDDDKWESDEVFYVGLWNSGSKNVGGLFKNSARVVVAENDLKSSDTSLQSVVLAGGGSELELSPDFSGDLKSYDAEAAYEVAELVVLPVVSHRNAAVTVNGAPSTDEGVAVGLSIGSNQISVTVTAEDGSTSTYMIHVSRLDHSDGDSVVVALDDFTLTCPRSTTTGPGRHVCVLHNTKSVAQDWPVVAIMNSSLDENPAQVTKVKSQQQGGVRLEDGPLVALENHKFGYAELLPRTDSGGYRTYDYEKIEWSATAAPDAKREVHIQVENDPSLSDPAFFYVSLAPHGYTGISKLVANRIPVVVTPIDHNIVVAPEGGLSVAEGGSAQYSVRLATRPSGDVTVAVSGHVGAGVTVSDASLTFTPADWNTAQAVTVTAAHDDNADDDPFELFFTASGGGYDAVTATLAVAVSDDDVAAVVVSPSALTVIEGRSSVYAAALSSEPGGDVTVAISVRDAAVGISVDQTELVFTPADWSTAQAVTVTAAVDADETAEQVVLAHTASGGGYDTVAVEDVTFTVVDVPQGHAAVQLGATSSPQHLTVPEGGLGTYIVVLSEAPAGDVVVAVSVHDADDVSIDRPELVFTPHDWDTAQAVTIAAADDDDADDVSLELRLSAAGGLYDVVLAVTVVDDDTAAIMVEPPDGLSVDEGGSVQYSVRLATRPSGEVTVSSDYWTLDGSRLYGGVVSQRFTPADWDIAQTMTVLRGEDDNTVNEAFELRFSSAGGGYDTVTATLPFTVIDNDTAAMVVEPGGGLSVDEGGSAQYSVRLATRPSGDVTVAVSGHVGAGATVSDASLTFTPADWNTAQAVTVTAAHDDNADDDPFELFFTASGGGYDAVTATLAVAVSDDGDAAGVVIDDGTAAIVVEPGGGLSVDEGASAQYSVRLATRPSGEVTVSSDYWTLDGSRLYGGVVLLTFTPADWDIDQTVTIGRGEDDNTDNEVYEIRFSASGGGYEEVTARLLYTVIDNDVEAIGAEPERPLDVNGSRFADSLRRLHSFSNIQVHSAAGAVLRAEPVTQGFLALAPATPVHEPPRATEAGSPVIEEFDIDTFQDPSLRFTEAEALLSRRLYIWKADDGRIASDGSSDDVYTGIPDPNGIFFFGTIAVDRLNIMDQNLRFTIDEGSQRLDYQHCNFHDENRCHDVKVGVLPNSGRLYLYADTIGKNQHHYTADFQPQSVQISAEDINSGLMIHRDIMIRHPEVPATEEAPDSSDCSDYMENNYERFNCLFNGQLLPRDVSTEATLLDSLPKLVQPPENYQLVFREEFNYQENDCADGIPGLDDQIWNFRASICAPENVCQDLRDGVYYMVHAPSCGGSDFETLGNVAFRYGYMEVKFTIENLNSPGYYNNMNMVVGNIKRPRVHHLDKYGITVNNYEDLTKTVGLEIDVFEYIPWFRMSVSHQYLNRRPYFFEEDLVPKRISKNFYLCGWQYKHYHAYYNIQRGDTSRGSCRPTYRRQPVTITLGLEWTPRGYRTFRMVEGFEEQLEVIRKNQIDVQYYPIVSRDPVKYSDSATSYRGAERDSYFEFLVPGDEESVLEQIGISHVPGPIHLGAWGHLSSAIAGSPGVMIDYVRVYQPANNYTDMEPLYQ